jgi:ribulose-5-phosphate 4-epimerase/fuculose-1-phosphate aldolase
VHATVLACLKEKRLPPLDQNAAMFFNRQAVDDQYGGLAFEDEGERCAHLMAEPKVKTLIMGNHGIMVIGDTVAETFNRLYMFERAAQVYITALQTGQPLAILSDEIAEKTAREIEEYPGGDHHHLEQLKAILDEEGSNYAT